MTGKFVSYLRVSTQRQGRSGLGLEAQRAAVAGFVAGRGDLVREYVEVETGKGADALDRRPELKAALAMCKREGAVLLIAKLDRLARNVHFVSGLIESGIDFVAADMPSATKTMIQMYSVMAEFERDQISARTKAALAAAKARGVVLGKTGPTNLRRNIEERKDLARQSAERLAPVLASMSGLPLRAKAESLTRLGIPAPKGGAWQFGQVRRIEHRIRESARDVTRPTSL
jgi:DNA invertase Pin-like site-specific DNA recombinase